jgi:hypothetical protein
MNRPCAHSHTCPALPESEAVGPAGERPCAAPVPDPPMFGFEGWPGTLRHVRGRSSHSRPLP